MNTAWPCGHFEALLWQRPIPSASVAECCCNIGNIMKYLDKSWNIQKTSCGWIATFGYFCHFRNPTAHDLLFLIRRSCDCMLNRVDEPLLFDATSLLWWFSFLASLEAGLAQKESWETGVVVLSHISMDFPKLSTKHESSWQPFISSVRLSWSWHKRCKLHSSWLSNKQPRLPQETGTHCAIQRLELVTKTYQHLTLCQVYPSVFSCTIT